MDDFKNYMKRFQNVGTILAIVGAIGLILQQFGYKVDMEWLNNTATAMKIQNGNRFKSRTL